MCVDDSLLSAYVDGEVDSSRLEQVESHLSVCDTCKGRLELWNDMSEQLRWGSLKETQIQDASQRVARRLNHLLVPGAERGFWTRRFSVSPSWALAALLAVASLGAVIGNRWLNLQETETQIPGAALASRDNYVEELRMLTAQYQEDPAEASIRRIFEMLESGGASIEVRIDLPRDSNFQVYGEPQLIRAAEFRGDSLR